MDLTTEDEKTLKKYLLGQLSSEEQEKIELWLLSEEDAYDMTEAAEDNLVDEFIGGKLVGEELEWFNNHFLAAAERRRKLQFGGSLQRFIDATAGTTTYGL